jgi:7-cyano-7-deazaguanine synthase
MLWLFITARTRAITLFTRTAALNLYKKMNDVCQIANYEPVDIISPYLQQTKIEILKDGLNMGLDYSKTWTCYNGREKACGKCGSCQERLEAFMLNQVTDPLPYE